MSTIYFDEEDRLEGVSEFFQKDMTTIHQSELPPEEASRIGRTNSVAEIARRQTELPLLHDKLDPVRITLVPAVADEISEIAVATGLTPPTMSNDRSEIQDLIDELEIQKEMLNHPEIPLPEIAELAGMEDSEKRGFLIQYANLVGELLELLSKLGDRDRKKNDHMRKEYDALNREVGTCIGDRGKTDFWSNMISFGVQTASIMAAGFLGLGTDNLVMRGADLLGRQIPAFTRLYSTGLEEKQSLSTNRLSMITTEMQNISQKSGDNSGWKNELIQNLNDIKQWMSAAVRQG